MKHAIETRNQLVTVKRTLPQVSLLAAALAVFPLGLCLAQHANPANASVPQGFECPKIDKPYVHLPIKNDAPEVRLRVKIDGVQQNALISIRLAQGKPDWNGYISVEQWMGKQLTIVPEQPLAGSGWIGNVKMSDQFPDEDSVYQEKYRPQFHVTARRGWINDVNGPFYLNGTYHLPFQHAPWRLGDSGTIESEKYFGHVISKDLVSWKEIGPVRFFTPQGCTWSGSIEIDWYNTAGLVKNPVKDKDGRLKNPAVVAFGNHGGPRLEDFVVGFTYSLDAGYHWTNYPGNPVIPAHSMGNRDPHILWYEDKADPAKSHWALVLYSGGGEDYLFYASKDLVHWELTSELKGAGGGECPDLYQIPLDGDKNNLKWIFWCGNGNYSIGSFDGRTFKKESGPFQTCYNQNKGGRDYAAQSFVGIPAEDGRHIYVAWMAGGDFPGMPFNQQLTLPRVLTLKTTADGPRFFIEPVREIEKLRTGVTAKMTAPLAGTEIQLKEDKPIGELVDLEAVFSINKGALTAEGENQIGLEVNGQKITCDLNNKKMVVSDSDAPLNIVDGKVKLRVIVDRMSIEIFANDGAVQLCRNFVPPDNAQYAIKVFGKKGLADVVLKAHQLRSIWKKQQPTGGNMK